MTTESFHSRLRRIKYARLGMTAAKKRITQHGYLQQMFYSSAISFQNECWRFFRH